MVREDLARGASWLRSRDGPESSAEALRVTERLLPRVPFRTALGPAQEYRVHV